MFSRLMPKIIRFLQSGTSMAMTNMNLIDVFVTMLWPVQVSACGCGGGDGGGATKNIIPPKFSNFGDIIRRFKTSIVDKHIHCICPQCMYM